MNKLPKVGETYIGAVVSVYTSYAIMLFDEGWTGLLHISEVSTSYIRSFASYITIGSIYNVKVIAVDEDSGQVRVSLKQMTNSERRKSFRHCPVDSQDIDFAPLAKMLPLWIAEENEGKETKANDQD